MRWKVSCALLVALMEASNNSFALAAPTPGCRVDWAHYASLEVGMSYQRVRDLLGCAGRRLSTLNIGEGKRATYSWAGRGSYGANLTLTFHNGHLTDKAQLGLK
ncbi:DUF3862 domain-containing protein [Bradyrhizobium sp. P5_C11_2]